MSIQSLGSALLGSNKLGCPSIQFEKVIGAFEWSHTYVPSMSRSFNPVQAVQFQIFEGQFTENERVSQIK